MLSQLDSEQWKALDYEVSLLDIVPLFHFLRRITSRPEKHVQPVPDVTPEDVERIVRRDFPADQNSTVATLLDEYKKAHSDSARVQLAALKLADGSLKKLSISLESARRDYRDVLVGAECPNYYKAHATTRTIPD